MDEDIEAERCPKERQPLSLLRNHLPENFYVSTVCFVAAEFERKPHAERLGRNTWDVKLTFHHFIMKCLVCSK